MAQRAVARPFDERHLDHEPRAEPEQGFHVLRRDALAPMAGLAVGQIDERTSFHFEADHAFHDVAPAARRQSGAYLTRVVELPALVIADEERLERRPARLESADDELLAPVEFHFYP